MANIEQTGVACGCIFVAAIVRGITGLGMAVVFMTMWVLLSICQLDTGNMKHVVAALTFDILVGSYPLLYTFNANKYGDYGICFFFVVFANIGCLFGTYLLQIIPIPRLQLVLAIVLLIVVAIRAVQEVRSFIRDAQERQNSHKQDSLIEKQDEEKEPLISEEEGDYQQYKVPIVKTRWQRFVIGTRDGLSKFAWVLVLALTGQVKYEKEDQQDFLTSFSIVPNKKSCIGKRQLQISYSKVFLLNIPWFSLGGILSGFLGCLVGVPGPPMILMFLILKFERNTIRAVATVFEVFTFRPIIFFLDGGLYSKDIPMYILSICSMLMGMMLGSLLADKVPQKWFIRCMDGLILMTTIMTFLKAFDLIPKH